MTIEYVMCPHGRVEGRCTECGLQTRVNELEQVTALLRKEKDVYEESARHWKHLVTWAYQRTSEALMIPANKPREARAARDQALCDINKKIGGALR